VGPRLPDNLLAGWSPAGHNETVQRIRTYAQKRPCYAKSIGRKPRGRSAHFNGAAEATGGQVLVPLDKDLADWLCKQGNLVREVNSLCRFTPANASLGPDKLDIRCDSASHGVPQ
jgi:hypothetical protein